MTVAEIVGLTLAVLFSAGITAAFVGRLVAERSIAIFALDIERQIRTLRRDLKKEAELDKNEAATQKKENKKTERLIQKQAEAAAAFFRLRREIDPKYAFPELNENETLRTVVARFSDIETELEKFIVEYSVFLDDGTRSSLNKCSVLACNHQFVSRSAVAQQEARDAAHEILAKMKSIEDMFAYDLRN
jgi:hypothetical protein